MFLAARLYLADSVFSEDDSWPIPADADDVAYLTGSLVMYTGERRNLRSRLSPRQSKSSMFLVMILVTSCRSVLSLSMLDMGAEA